MDHVLAFNFHLKTVQSLILWAQLLISLDSRSLDNICKTSIIFVKPGMPTAH